MSEIMHHILYSDRDPNGHMFNLDDWSESIAYKLANDINLSIDESHIKILVTLRSHYKEHGPWKAAREVLKLLEACIASAHPRKVLYQMFPGGPVKRTCYLAGLPQPADCEDMSFGTSQ